MTELQTTDKYLVVLGPPIITLRPNRTFPLINFAGTRDFTCVEVDYRKDTCLLDITNSSTSKWVSCRSTDGANCAGLMTPDERRAPRCARTLMSCVGVRDLTLLLILWGRYYFWMISDFGMWLRMMRQLNTYLEFCKGKNTSQLFLDLRFKCFFKIYSRWLNK